MTFALLEVRIALWSIATILAWSSNMKTTAVVFGLCGLIRAVEAVCRSFLEQRKLRELNEMVLEMRERRLAREGAE